MFEKDVKGGGFSMKSELKEQLRQVFDAPDSRRKEEFLQNFNYPKATYREFVFHQIGYIRKRVWGFSLVLLLSVFAVCKIIKDIEATYSMIWVISSLFPLLALLASTEIARSSSFRMSELEMTTRFNLGEVLLMRMGILGLTNAFVFGIVLFFVSFKINYGCLQLGLYLSVPYLITCLGSLMLMNRISSREVVYCCAGVSCFVIVCNGILANSRLMIYSDKFVFFWIILFILLCIAITNQSSKLIKNTEALQWN